MRSLPHPLMRPMDGAPVGAPPPFLGGTWKGFLAVAWQNSGAKMRRENGIACSPFPACGEKERANIARKIMINAKKKSSGWRPSEKRRTSNESQAQQVAARTAQARRDCDRLRLWRCCPAKLCLRLRRCTGDPWRCKEQRAMTIATPHPADARPQAAAALAASAATAPTPAALPAPGPPRTAAAPANAPPRFAMSAAEAAAAIAASIANNSDSRFLSGDDLEAIVRDGAVHYEPRRRR
jgi:hypothetical protein